MSIAAMLYPDVVDEQKFWVSQARNAFMSFSLYLFENWQDMKQSGFPGEHGTPTLGAIYRLSSGDGTELKAFLQSLSKREFLSANARGAFANLLSQAEETFASIMGSFREPLNAWINPVLDAATSDNDFMLRSEEHTSELKSLMHISYAVFCLKKNIKQANRKRQ